MKRPAFLSWTAASRAKFHSALEARICRRRPATAGPMSPEAEAISARAAESSQSNLPQPEQPVPQQGDIQDKLASVGIHGDEADSILDMYGLDPQCSECPGGCSGRCRQAMEEQVQDAYIQTRRPARHTGRQ